MSQPGRETLKPTKKPPKSLWATAVATWEVYTPKDHCRTGSPLGGPGLVLVELVRTLIVAITITILLIPPVITIPGSPGVRPLHEPLDQAGYELAYLWPPEQSRNSPNSPKAVVFVSFMQVPK